MTKVEISIPAGKSVVDVQAALQAQLCGSAVPPECEVTQSASRLRQLLLLPSAHLLNDDRQLTSGGSRQLASGNTTMGRSTRQLIAGSASFDTKRQLDKTSTTTLTATAVNPDALASSLGVDSSQVVATVGTSNVQATVVVTKEGSAASAEADSAVSALSDTSAMASALGVATSAIDVQVAPKVIAPPKPPPLPPPPAPPSPSPSPPVEEPAADPEVVLVVWTLAGDVDAFAEGTAARDQIVSAIATAAAVPPTSISIQVLAASVQVLYRAIIESSGLRPSALMASLLLLLLLCLTAVTCLSVTLA